MSTKPTKTTAQTTPAKTATKAPAKATKKVQAVSVGKAKPPSGQAKSTVVTSTPALPKPAEATAVAEKKPAPRPTGAHGRRDPFVSPIRNVGAVGPASNCTGGKRCLAIPELILQGTVRDISGKMMAVVVNSSRHTYMLRENDQVFNGSVEKITTDSIIFREFVKDALGRETAREVVKKMGPTS